ncbi:MAG: glycosyltransferase [Nitrospirae bacterium]|nr:glycosyltransferase [Nitrospirota bacterium]
MFKLVITVSLKKELPLQWLKDRGLTILTTQAIESGALKGLDTKKIKDPLIVVTGVGPQQANRAAKAIATNLTPLFVLHIGTCGILRKDLPLRKWLRPRWLSSSCSEELLMIDPRIPLPVYTDLTDIRLHEVSRPFRGSLDGIDAVDMECYSQARVFKQAGISFHALKFGTDYADHNRDNQYHESLPVLHDAIKQLFSFLDGQFAGEDVSVVIPVYNRPDLVKRAIDSVLNQSLSPGEIIVVDDGSTDNTWEVLKNYKNPIRAIRLEENLGPSAARNKGVLESTGRWIAFLDSDDYWKEDKIERQLEYLKRYPYFEILQSEEIWIRNGKRVNPCKHHKKPEGWAWEPSLRRCLISPSGVMMKRDIFFRYGPFREDFPVCEDYDLWLKITRGHPVGLEPSFTVVKYGGHGDQLSRRYPAMDRFRVKSLFEQFEREPYPEFREKLKEVINEKLKILYKGYKKRSRWEDVKWCEQIWQRIGYEKVLVENL